MGSSRHLGRVLVLKTLFAYEFHGGDPEALLEYVAREFQNEQVDLEFPYKLLNGVLRHLPESHSLISKYAPQWPVEKIARVDRAALEIALFEMLHSDDVPPVVAIDEAIELVKTFGSENSQKFVNGVLNAILEKHHKFHKSST